MLTIDYGDMSLVGNYFRVLFFIFNIPIIGLFAKFCGECGEGLYYCVTCGVQYFFPSAHGAYTGVPNQ